MLPGSWLMGPILRPLNGLRPHDVVLGFWLLIERPCFASEFWSSETRPAASYHRGGRVAIQEHARVSAAAGGGLPEDDELEACRS